MADLSKVPTENLLKMRDEALAKSSKPDISKIPTEDLLRMKDEALNRERPKTTPGEAALTGAAQMATAGFADEITAAAGAAKDWLSGKLGQRGYISFKDAYKSYIKPIRRADETAQADQPGAYLAGGVAGGIASALVPGVGIAKGTGLLKGVGKASALGAVAGAGMSKVDPTESYDAAKEFTKEVAKAGLTGAVTQGAFSVAAKGLSALRPENLRKFANIKAVKSAGAIGSDLKNLGPEATQEVGKQLREGGIVKAFSDVEEVLNKISTKKEESGKLIGKALEKVDDLVVEAKGLVDADAFGKMPDKAKQALKDQLDKQFQFNMRKIGNRIYKEVVEPNIDNPNLRNEVNKLSSLAEDYMQFSPRTLVKGGQIKAAQGKMINWNSETVPQAFKKEVYDILKTELDDIVGRTEALQAGVQKASVATGRALPGAAESVVEGSASKLYEQAKKTYGAMAKAEKIAEKRVGSLAGNREISLSDYIAGATGAVTGGAPAAVVLGGMNKLVRKYGDSSMMAMAGALANVIEKAPQALGKYSDVIQKAMESGAPTLIATHRMLMKEPDYRDILDAYEETAMTRRANRLKGTK